MNHYYSKVVAIFLTTTAINLVASEKPATPTDQIIAEYVTEPIAIDISLLPTDALTTLLTRKSAFKPYKPAVNNNQQLSSQPTIPATCLGELPKLAGLNMYYRNLTEQQAKEFDQFYFSQLFLQVRQAAYTQLANMQNATQLITHSALATSSTVASKQKLIPATQVTNNASKKKQSEKDEKVDDEFKPKTSSSYKKQPKDRKKARSAPYEKKDSSRKNEELKLICTVCGAEFNGRGAQTLLTKHRNSQHPDESDLPYTEKERKPKRTPKEKIVTCQDCKQKFERDKWCINTKSCTDCRKKYVLTLTHECSRCFLLGSKGTIDHHIDEMSPYDPHHKTAAATQLQSAIKRLSS